MSAHSRLRRSMQAAWRAGMYGAARLTARRRPPAPRVRPYRRAILVFALFVLSLAGLRLWPHAPLADHFASSRSVLAADGRLLRLSLAADGQYRLWTPLPQIAPSVREAVLLYEDRWFDWHPGVNPLALARAAYSSVSGGRRMGASTISMQLARRLYGIDSRSLHGKLWQIGAALWLEARYAKREILEAYLNSAPYGGNVEGVAAAALIYWNTPAHALNLAQALNLAVIPQNPNKRQGQAQRQSNPALQQARQRLAQRWRSLHPQDAAWLTPASLELPFARRNSLPFLAPHLSDMLLRGNPGRVLHSTIQPQRQALLERIMREYLKSRRSDGLRNASALLLDAATMQVQALVGSNDWFDPHIEGQVNGVLAKRSPGSTLKPFIYGLALDQGIIHAGSVLKDAPRHFGAFAPENFDGRYAGPLPAGQALIRSRNVPAVALAARLQQPGLYQFLRMAGVRNMQSEAHYGLALALGGGDLSMEELAGLYAMLYNQGRWQALRYLQDGGDRAQALPLLSAEAAYIVLDMLRQTPRPDSFAPARPAIAWKTGTSWGFHDAWTAGVFGRYVLVVWVGNFDNTPNPALIGVEAAAPLFLRMVDALRAEKLDSGEQAFSLPPRLQKIRVCSASGDLPDQDCPATSEVWSIAGVSPMQQSRLHRRVLLDMRSGQQVCAPSAHTRSVLLENWGTEMAKVYRDAGLPLRAAAAPASPCQNSAATPAVAPEITSPIRGVSHILRSRQSNAPLQLRAEASPGTELLWFADAALLGRSKAGASLAWTPPQAGRYILRVLDENGMADSRELVVEQME
ncbi:penicillin-binding protein 1C [Massilia sp. W12]|uniref:penicillin-binding protein 1C n=1 Tax=Massilia sp. W12 TaxID=3126507 RepID=UPI0030CE7F55